MIQITFILVYGSDGTGKSVQCKNIAEAVEDAEHWSFYEKNRNLYTSSGIVSKELVKFTPDYDINPYTTMDAFHEAVAATIKDNKLKCVVIDEMTQFREWAQPVTIEWYNRKFTNKITKIGEDNALAWEYVNKITYGVLRKLTAWATSNKGLVIAITALDDVRVREAGSDGKMHSVATGAKVAKAKENVMKLADVRIRLEKDGANGKGYYAIFEKTQDWMLPGKDGKDTVKVGKDGLLTELIARGVIQI